MVPFNELIRSEKPVLVDFYADWCGPCKAMAPVLSEVAREVAGDAKVIKINVDKNVEAARNYQIQGVPTFMIFRNGKAVWRHSGMIDKNSLINMIRQNA